MTIKETDVKNINDGVNYVVSKYLGNRKNHQLALNESVEYLNLWDTMPEDEQKRFKKLQLLTSLSNTKGAYINVVLATNPIGWTYFLGKSLFRIGKMSEKDKMIMELNSEPFVLLLSVMREGQIYRKIKFDEEIVS